ncbi:MAG: copper amine oxidase N-terminal domain-containing protein, partial [bacterium]
IIDADGVEANADFKDLEFSVSNTRLATINKDGILKAKDDVEGIVTVTVVNTKHNVVATTEVRIGDVGAAGIEFDVPETLLVGEEYTIGMTVVDEDGKEYMDEPDFNAVVLSKPAGAKVEVDVYDDELEVYSDTKGEVKLIVTAREDDESVSGTLTLNFVTEPVKPAAGKVVLTIGANFGLVDGAVTDLDAPAFIAEGRTFVPVRFIAEALGAEADWEPKDAAVETVYLTWDDMQIVIGIGDEFLTVIRDGEEEVMTFDGAARIVDGRTYLPFRAIGEAIGLEVDYGPKDGPVEWVSFE